MLDNTETLNRTVASLYAEVDRERRRNAELQEQVRNLTVSVEELKTFARDVSHDLKAPLAGICGYAQLLEHLDLDFGRPPEYDEFVAEINQCTDRMRQLIDDVLHFTTLRETRVHVLPVDLNTLVDDMIVDATGLIRPTPAITHDRLPAVQGDHGLVRRLLENLMGNAIKYVRPGQAARVHISAEAGDDGMVRIAVCDQGVGIPDGQHEEIFKELHRAHPDAYPGSGLGLSICRRIVQRLGGDIGADPQFRDGARIWFRLPAARTSDGSAPVPLTAGRAV